MNDFPGISIVREFEYKIANYCCSKYCLSVSNATIGILGVFYALGLSNSEIITTPLTWAGALSGLKLLNCKFKFCDVEPDYLTINPDRIESLISPETKAVFSADFLGYPARLDKIKEICSKYNLLLIHDAASSFGSRFKGFYSGHFADVTILSFGAKKLFSIGEGGCVMTDNDRICKQLTKLLMHPNRQNTESLECNTFALNTNINPFAAQYGLKIFDDTEKELQLRRKKISSWIIQRRLNTKFKDCKPNYYKILVSPEDAINLWEGISIENLPFKNLIYKEPGYSEFRNAINYYCPIAEYAINYYKILSDPVNTIINLSKNMTQ